MLCTRLSTVDCPRLCSLKFIASFGDSNRNHFAVYATYHLEVSDLFPSMDLAASYEYEIYRKLVIYDSRLYPLPPPCLSLPPLCLSFSPLIPFSFSLPSLSLSLSLPSVPPSLPHSPPSLSQHVTV